MPKKHVVATVADIPPGGRKLVTADGRAIVVFNLAGEFFALSNRCPHRGGSLCQGRQTGLVESDGPGHYRYSRPGEIIRCPWHGWEFDIRTGQSWCDPTRVRARPYTVSVQPGTRLVAGPYVAETVPVSVENDYVVVEA
jgi:3-phenylpropionate/trans-cinnamate dioxygenase ferredoxin subunit